MTDTPHDPFEALADPPPGPGPRPAFVRALRTRLLRALDLQPEAPVVDLPPRRSTMDTTTSGTATTADTGNPPDHRPGEATPYLAVADAAGALAFYELAFGAVEHLRVEDGDGRIGHADFTIGPARFFIADEFPELGVVSPSTAGATTVTLHLDVDDVDDAFDRATRAGATVLGEPEDQPHGARHCTVVDPFGHRWMLSQQVERVDTAEYDARLRAADEPWTATGPGEPGGRPAAAGGIWPAVGAADAPALIHFLVDVVGFTEQIVVEEDGVVVHSQLRWPEGGIVQVATANRPDDVYSQRPVGSDSVYVITADPGAVHERCVAAGADIISPPQETDYDPGGSVFSMRDAEGNIWSFGTYAGEG